MADDTVPKAWKKGPTGPEQHLKLRQVKVFLEAARHENFGAAGRNLGTSTTYVSETIAALERDLGEGVVLFDRSRAGTRLTEVGHLFVTKAEELLSAENAARRAIENLGKHETSLLRITYEPDFANLALSAASKVMNGQPGLRIEAVEVEVGTVTRRVQSGDTDIGLGLLTLEFDQDLVHKAVVTDTLSLLAATTHKFARIKMKTGGAGPEYLPLAELADEPFALPWFDRSTAADVIGLRRAVEEYFRAHNFRPQNIIFRSNSRSAVVEMVKRGQAVTICDRFARYGASDRYNAWSLQPTPPQQRGALVFRKGEEESATIAAIIQAVLHDVSEKPRTLFVDIQALRDNKKSPERAAEEVSAKRSIIRKQVSKNEPSEPVSKDKLD